MDLQILHKSLRDARQHLNLGLIDGAKAELDGCLLALETTFNKESGGAEQNPSANAGYAWPGNVDGKGRRPSDDQILTKAKEVIPEDLYKDCGGYVTIEDQNREERNILIEGINIGLNWPSEA